MAVKEKEIKEFEITPSGETKKMVDNLKELARLRNEHLQEQQQSISRRIK